MIKEIKSLPEREYAVTYLGIGGGEEEETYTTSLSRIGERITFLEERGVHSIIVVDNSTDTIVYEDGGFTNLDYSLEIKPLVELDEYSLEAIEHLSPENIRKKINEIPDFSKLSHQAEKDAESALAVYKRISLSVLKILWPKK